VQALQLVGYVYVMCGFTQRSMARRRCSWGCHGVEEVVTLASKYMLILVQEYKDHGGTKLNSKIRTDNKNVNWNKLGFLVFHCSWPVFIQNLCMHAPGHGIVYYLFNRSKPETTATETKLR
jgi:hypothetical protein